jgi:hypothetical protein
MIRHRYNLFMRPRSLLIAVIVFFATFALAQTARRLILKDGSYQDITKYEIKGDRVRYFSAERFDWEEMPKELVDWPATQKYEQEMKKGVSHTAEEIDRETEEDKKEEDARTPEVAPNLRLPDSGGVYVLDYFHERPELIQLQQATSELNADRTANILRATINPFAGAKQKIEVPGAHSKVQVHVPRPEIYINVDDAPSDATNDSSDTRNDAKDAVPQPAKNERYRIVRMESKRDSRVLGNLKVSLTGKTSQQETFIPTSGEPMSGGWVKVTPLRDLEPGEYAIVEMLNDKEMNLYVWDLGENPSAPENPTAWKPAANPQPQAPAAPPKLNKRPDE